VNLSQIYNQERGCLVHFARLATTLLKNEGSAQDNRVLARNFAKYSPILKKSRHFGGVDWIPDNSRLSPT